MARKIELTPVRTYATEKNAIAAVDKKIGRPELIYFIHRTPENRYFPVFVGQDALSAGIHFHFNVVA